LESGQAPGFWTIEWCDLPPKDDPLVEKIRELVKACRIPLIDDDPVFHRAFVTRTRNTTVNQEHQSFPAHLDGNGDAILPWVYTFYVDSRTGKLMEPDVAVVQITDILRGQITE
jgi:hypothetical protein